ncbi:inner-membrane translocator [Methylobacterium sp. 4-46]|uniref:branched-chain amino acid ABC transporter permease n=1 Tax=unclassified Methylobacterium TaxID=2615210 RepID=UPI000152D87D|nr:MULTISPECIES: branched-chain amino acid ABC transporter permease [Methylobacterium]ACA17573.1 inner-membrane translocator [Methylobacterium sp. 4-46]WFT83249.1 branched-chain amino acid ABC transporter permease [Methylobacterium nodulans]
MTDLAHGAAPDWAAGRPAAAAAPPRRGLLGRVAPWLAAAAILAAAPQVFSGGTALTMLSLMGIAIVFALSYNMLLGQTGLLSFGHAVYYGLGAFFTVHAMNAVAAGRLPIPLAVMPLVGAATGLGFGLVFGAVSTRRAGTVFAMISLGLAELVASGSHILHSFFGGEEGVTTNRTKMLRLFDLSFGPQIQVYYLIAGWCLICALLMYGITRTPLGRLCNAVRENPERVEFIGYEPRTVRLIAFCLSAGFAGVAGALAAINFEIVNVSYLSLNQSGVVLLAAFIGGIGHFVGPVIGAVVVTILQVSLSDLTEVWQLYFGLLFIAIVMFAPGGLAGLALMHGPLLRAGTAHRLLPAYALALPPALALVLGLIGLIEMSFHALVKAGEGSALRLFGLALDVASPLPWLLAAAALAAGILGLRAASPRVAAAWHEAAPAGPEAASR